MATAPDTTSPLSEVQIEALVVMRIIKHATSTFPTPATGFLVGTDIASQLQVTNSFPLPAAPIDQAQADSYHQPDAATLATAAPRAKSNVPYQNEMIKLLREVNVDAQSVGWYMSTNMGNFISQSFVENQFFYQKASDEKSVALVFDVSRSSAGSLGLKAYRLSPVFMTAYKEGKFTSERYVSKGNSLRCWRMLMFPTASRSRNSDTRISSSSCLSRSTTLTSSPASSTRFPRHLLRRPPSTSPPLSQSFRATPTSAPTPSLPTLIPSTSASTLSSRRAAT